MVGNRTEKRKGRGDHITGGVCEGAHTLCHLSTGDNEVTGPSLIPGTHKEKEQGCKKKRLENIQKQNVGEGNTLGS